MSNIDLNFAVFAVHAVFELDFFVKFVCDFFAVDISIFSSSGLFVIRGLLKSPFRPAK